MSGYYKYEQKTLGGNEMTKMSESNVGLSDLATRTKLAEAMGWTRFYVSDLTGAQFGRPPNSRSGKVLPDPFTDANDDYAVLQWAIRKLDTDKFISTLADIAPYFHKYQKGDYARAALKVLDND